MTEASPSDMSKVDKNEINNTETFNYFFSALIVSCCFVLVIPKMSNSPNTLLFCYFFITFSVISLFFNWYWSVNKPEILYYILPSLLFIVVSLVAAFLMVSNNKLKIQKGYVTSYYYKFSLVSIWLILIECYLFYYLYRMISNKIDDEQLKLYMIVIICFCCLSYFVTWTNTIGLTYFSADG
jgi:hypothetical protein